LYLQAMDEIGADSTEIRGFVAQLGLGARWEDVLNELRVPPGVARFVKETLRCATQGSLVEAASCFLFGGEDVIPEMISGAA
jgi:Protein of unknown function (DUF3050)